MLKKVLFLLCIALGIKACATNNENAPASQPKNENSFLDGLHESIKKKQEKIERSEKELLNELDTFNQEELATLKEIITNEKLHNDAFKEMTTRRLSKIDTHLAECAKKHGYDHLECILPLYTQGTYYNYYAHKNPCNDQEERNAEKILAKKTKELENANNQLFRKCFKCELFMLKVDSKIANAKMEQAQEKILKKDLMEKQNPSGKGISSTEKHLYEANKANVEYLDSFFQKVIDGIEKRKNN
jgi:hypothetical protein